MLNYYAIHYIEMLPKSFTIGRRINIYPLVLLLSGYLFSSTLMMSYLSSQTMLQVCWFLLDVWIVHGILKRNVLHHSTNYGRFFNSVVMLAVFRNQGTSLDRNLSRTNSFVLIFLIS